MRDNGCSWVQSGAALCEFLPTSEKQLDFPRSLALNQSEVEQRDVPDKGSRPYLRTASEAISTRPEYWQLVKCLNRFDVDENAALTG